MKLNNNTIFDCNLIELSQVSKSSGYTTILENGKNIPFDVKRVYYLYNIPTAEERGGHAHYELEQYIVAISGSFDVILNDGVNKKTVTLNRPNTALHIVPGLWRDLTNFSSESVCLVLASHIYDAKDYIRDYNKFINKKNEIFLS